MSRVVAIGLHALRGGAEAKRGQGWVSVGRALRWLADTPQRFTRRPRCCASLGGTIHWLRDTSPALRRSLGRWRLP